MTVNSKQKGNRGERELAAKLTEIFSIACRRGQQFSGSPDSPDVVGLSGLHFECKRTEKLQLYKAVDQAIRDAGDNIPLVAHRANKKPWIIALRLDDLLEFVKAVARLAPEQNEGRMEEN